MASDEVKVLLIDDDGDDFINFRDLLLEARGTKYKIEWKSSYKSGLEAVGQNHYDICFLDYYLGEKTGLDFLKESQGRRVCPVILLTGHGNLELDLLAMETGASDYLVKSQINSDLLDRAIRYSIKHAQDVQAIKDREFQILQQDRLASLGLLASSLAHEIGTPLGIIRGRAELIAKKFGHLENLKSDMDVITTQIDRVAKLVNSLLHLARGKNSEFVTAVDFKSVLKDVLNLVTHEFDRKSISFELETPDDVLVKAEAGPLGQVLLNLLVNSVHAIEEAQKQGRQMDHKILLSAKEDGDIFRVNISDTGVGIREQNLSQLFKPFFTTKAIGVGTGLGLATSLKLVQSWGGDIVAVSPPGKGATFTVILKKVTTT